MLTYHLGVDDLARVRLAYSPMCETALSLWPLVLGTRSRPHLDRWHEHAAGVADGYDQELVRALVSPSGTKIPDFIMPIPGVTRPDIESECAAIAATDPDEVAQDLAALTGGQAPPPALAPLVDDPTQAAAVIAEVLREYHHAVIAPLWNDIARILESDVTVRGREFARRGAVGLFDGLAEQVTLMGDGQVEVRLTSGVDIDDLPVGRGLVLTPSVFIGGVAAGWKAFAHGPSWIAYPARGQGTLTDRQPTLDRDAALADLVGTAKASILLALGEPASTSDVARHFSVSPSAVSQNLRVLRENGLVESSRHGREVLHRLSELGAALTVRARSR